ncbi:hypothetical protein INT82_02340 [Mannheimia haemolytica]|nr:hypothetical protein [Mannheimia haemolytica]
MGQRFQPVLRQGLPRNLIRLQIKSPWSWTVRWWLKKWLNISLILTRGWRNERLDNAYSTGEF